MSNNKDFKVKNSIQPTVYQEGLGTVVSGSEGYSLSSACYDSKSFSVASQETGGTGIFLKPDGTKVYICGFAGDEINEYDLSTAYDISTATFNQLFSISAQEASSRQVFFKSDGTSMYIIGVTNDTVYQYTLSTAWDISTASYASKSFSVASQDTGPVGMSFKSDGTKMYISGSSSGNNVYQYSLSTAWDVSTASYDSVSFTATGVSSLRGVWFSSDGTHLYLVDGTTIDVSKATLSTAWDISTASMTSETLGVSSQDPTIYNVYGNSDGTKLYLMGSGNDTIYQYSTVLTTKTLDLSTGSVFEITPTSDIEVALSNPASSGTSSGATLLLDGGNAGGYDLGNAAYDSVSFSVAGQETDPQGLTLSSDGTKMYIAGNANNSVFQYSLSTAFDISSASYDSVSFSVASQETTPTGLKFNSDGSKLFVVGQATDAVYQYSLSTSFDLSTASYDSVSFSLSSQTASPNDIAFNTNGTKMYAIAWDGSTIRVFQYSLSTAFNVGTASYDSVSFDVGNEESDGRDLAFNSTGTKMFVVGSAGDAIFQYSLSTAFDLSSASYDSISFSVRTQATSPQALSFKDDGTKVYICDTTTDTIYQYSTATPATITYPSTLKWPSGTAPTSPAIGDTDVITFNTIDGGTTYKSVVAIDGAS